MPIVQEFEYVCPKTLNKAVKVLSKRGRKASVLAGGTDLVGLLMDDLARPDVVVDIKRIEKLQRLEFKEGRLFIGALVTFSDLLESDVVRDKFPVIPEMVRWVASRGIRNRATMVGNICSAVPCCDSGPVLMLYEAEVLVKGASGKRRIPIEQWFKGPRKTALKKGEVAMGVTLPLPVRKHAACFIKLKRYAGEDLAQASVSVMAFADQEYRVAYGSVAPTPMRGTQVETLLRGQQMSEELIAEAVKLARQEVRPITDIRSSKEYRAHMIGVMLERGLTMAAARLAGKGPKYGEDLI